MVGNAGSLGERADGSEWSFGVQGGGGFGPRRPEWCGPVGLEYTVVAVTCFFL
jgi:hypothetical protein